MAETESQLPLDGEEAVEPGRKALFVSYALLGVILVLIIAMHGFLLSNDLRAARHPDRPSFLPLPFETFVSSLFVLAMAIISVLAGQHLGAFCRAETPATPHRSPPGGSCPGESRQQGEIAVPLQHLARHPHAAERRHGHDLHRPLPRKRPGQGEGLPRKDPPVFAASVRHGERRLGPEQDRKRKVRAGRSPFTCSRSRATWSS